jgi:hypothetical protein
MEKKREVKSPDIDPIYLFDKQDSLHQKNNHHVW